MCAATQIKDGKQVAVKRVVGAFDSRRDALCIIREVRILAALPRHDNIVNLLDVRTPLENPSDDADVFLIFEKAATDLEKVVASNQYFTGDHIRWLSLDLLGAWVGAGSTAPVLSTGTSSPPIVCWR